MTLDRIYLLPHGDEIIDLPDSGARKMNSVISELAERDSSDVIVISSPHGVKLPSSLAVVNTENFEGAFQLQSKRLHRKLKNERDLADSILRSLPDQAEEVGFVTTQGDKSVFPLDFGTLIPLEFFTDRPIVYLGQPRTMDRRRLQVMGRGLYRAISEYGKSVSLVISADQAHTHDASGPYGYSDMAGPYEEVVIRSIRENDFAPLIELSDSLIEKARPDSYWNLIMLSEILKESGRSLTFDYNYVAVYFGMLCAHSF